MAQSQVLSQAALCAGPAQVPANSATMKKLREQKVSYSGFKIQWTLLHFISTVIEDFKLNAPVTLYFTREAATKKILKTDSKTGPLIMISSDAEDLLFGPEFAAYREGLCAMAAVKETPDLNVAALNPVYEQLLQALASKDQIEAHLIQKTGWRLYDPSVPAERPFSPEELISIEKQIVGIPSAVFKSMSLKQLARQQSGVALPLPSSGALFVEHEQKIIFADKAFIEKPAIYGIGTVAHEMGAAFWAGKNEAFRDEFRTLSWKKLGLKWAQQPQFANGFVSDVAATAPEKDFAEHFSAFLNQPDWLKSKAPAKYAFFKKRVFSGTPNP